MTNKKNFLFKLFNDQASTDKAPEFSGPLDLLLSLINEEKLTINELSLSQVTEQYLDHLATVEDKKPEELADFLLIAARLLLLKSKSLLPELSEKEEDGISLEDQLRLYQAFVQAAKKLNKHWLNKLVTNFRFEPTRQPKEFVLPNNLGLESMHQSMVKLLERLRPLKPLPQAQIDRGISLQDKIEQFRVLLKNKQGFNFRDVLQNSQNRTEVIVGFLALLELVKAKNIVLKQRGVFTDILIENV